MKYTLIICCLLFSTLSKADIPIFEKFDRFEETVLSNANSDTTYVINFWATWCAPCVKELPYFDEYGKKNANKPVKVLLVSMDFKSRIQSQLVPFIEKKKIESEVVVLADPKQSAWIDKVDSNWSGAIPATIFIVNGKKYFKEKSYHSLQELENEINQLSK
ncbi:TlpA disulfide reductase family protein [Reichenbachiella versicolor]|uniref:TlpA disulfide reductase family protein n=1 Tax=Reichenbachiella versicolor TaxID=1821036 RepID=UPI000D6E44B4|nr:TlpA disulfide reductase family protein [Reichenbachiella versicolor]